MPLPWTVQAGRVHPLPKYSATTRRELCCTEVELHRDSVGLAWTPLHVGMDRLEPSRKAEDRIRTALDLGRPAQVLTLSNQQGQAILKYTEGKPKTHTKAQVGPCPAPTVPGSVSALSWRREAMCCVSLHPHFQVQSLRLTASQLPSSQALVSADASWCTGAAPCLNTAAHVVRARDQVLFMAAAVSPSAVSCSLEQECR